MRSIPRIGLRGLSSACVEGVFATSAPCVAVMDADLQHDEKILSAMLDALRPVIVDINVGSRYVAGGDVGEWAGIDQSARDTGALGRRAARPE